MINVMIVVIYINGKEGICSTTDFFFSIIIIVVIYSCCGFYLTQGKMCDYYRWIGRNIFCTLLFIICKCNGTITNDKYQTENWYNPIYYFGGPSYWNMNNRMSLINNYTFQINNLQIDQNSEFMFVSEASKDVHTGKYPPLGEKNWKQGKIGVGPVLTSIYDNDRGEVGYTFKLYPGGGGGRMPINGIYNVTVFTNGHPTTPNIIKLKAKQIIPFCRLVGDKFVYDAASVDKTTGIKINIICTDETLLSNFIYDFEILNGNLIEVAADKKSALISWHKDGLVEIELKSKIKNQFTGSRWSFLISSKVETKSRWGGIVKLRDNSNKFPNVLNDDMDPDGWYVTPIHANVVGLTGHVVISGWLRRDDMPCRGGVMSGGRRRAAISFNVDPSKMFNNNDSAKTIRTVDVERIEEESQCTFELGPTGLKSAKDCMEDGLLVDGDSIYCAGHTTLEDGRIFYIGGARYAYMSQDREHEWGLDYGRLYDPEKNTFTSILNHRMPLGRSWYPSASRLADGRVLVTGAFTDYSTASCLGVSCYNPQINIFDIKKYDLELDPWSVLINKEFGQPDINPGIREYTRVFVLPEPQIGPDGIARDVLLSGKAGRIWLLSTNENVPMKNRFYKPPNGQRDPDGCFWDPTGSSDQSTAVHLNTRGGELFIMGGCTSNRTTLQEIDIYNVKTDSWKKIHTGIRRGVPASIILPDGKILIVSGEDKEIDQNFFDADKDGPGDPRFPQIFDPDTYELTTLDNREDIYRGYHNMAALLQDGSVMIGGGFNQFGDVGCENPHLRLLYPPYLHDLTNRPVLQFDEKWPAEKPLTFYAGQNEVSLLFNGATSLDNVKGVALLAVQAFTHSYGQNQRYVKMGNIKQSLLKFENGDHEVTFDVPTIPKLLAGHYHLFLISDKGVPSIAKHTIITHPMQDNRPSVHDDPNNGIKLTTLEIVLIVFMGFICIFFVAFAGLSCTAAMNKRRSVNNSKRLLENDGYNVTEDGRQWKMNPARASAIKNVP